MTRSKVNLTTPGGNYFDERDQQLVVKRAVRRIEQLGYRVTVEAA